MQGTQFPDANPLHEAHQNGTSVVVISTERLDIRRINESDAPFMLALLRDPGFVLHIGDRGVRTLDDAVAYIRERILGHYDQHGFGMDIVVLRATNQPIGIVGLVKRDSLEYPDLGFAFLEPHTKRGYGFEAATALLELDLYPDLFAITSMHNVVSGKLLTKLGFKRLGNLALPGESRTVCLFERTTPRLASVQSNAH